MGPVWTRPVLRSRRIFSTPEAAASRPVEWRGYLRIAVDVGCDPRSVVRYVRGELKRDSLHQKITAVLISSGNASLVRSPPTPVAVDYSPKSRA